MQNHQKNWPIMCMEYWDGWFNRWGEPIITRDPEELATEVKEMLEIGSLNLYMFHGGTNFGFIMGVLLEAIQIFRKSQAMITMHY